MNTEQLRKDMEAGTHKRTALTYNDVEWCAKRIAELERIALAAEELYAATLNYQAHKLGTVLKLGKAQDKYREATK